VPTLDPARCPAPMVSCRKICPRATSAEGGGRKDDTESDETFRQVSACRHDGWCARPCVTRRARQGVPRHPESAVASDAPLTTPVACRSL